MTYRLLEYSFFELSKVLVHCEGSKTPVFVQENTWAYSQKLRELGRKVVAQSFKLIHDSINLSHINI